MSGEDEAATYAEIKDVSTEAFEMDVNKCYSNITSTLPKSKSDRKESFSNGVRYITVGSVLVLVTILVAITVCVVYALVEISKLKSRVGNDLSTFQENQNSCCVKSAVNTAALQEQLSMLQQNMSEADEDIVASLAPNSAELSEFRQKLSQLQLSSLLTRQSCQSSGKTYHSFN